MRGVALLAAVVLAVVLLCGVPLNSIRECLEAPYSNPPSSFRDSDLLGTWEAHYGQSIDRVILKADGTFKQVYEDNYVEGYVYETPWNAWSVERFPDGRARVHLEGARYYTAGIATAELDGMHFGGPELWGRSGPPPYPFYDPFADETVDMVGELILNVRTNPSAELLLHHMFIETDRGFAIIGCQWNIFRHVNRP
ncbi:MAG: hypothetical protein GTO63_04360 [Anaerolineae bacterium]|nr:hypothetical protein [Anaerolineae bacterium]NIN94244.1 hypothetical protein [Anaerolineae bacterium]NIQ77312.1 hypothetical protein [Anaerolineae bacterium]